MTMIDLITDALMFPYRKGLIEQPAAGAPLLFLNAETIGVLKDINLPTLIQPRFDKAGPLIEAGYKIERDPQGKFHTIWVLPGKDMTETQYLLSQAVHVAADGAILLTAAPNDAGGKRLEGLFEELGLVPHVESKHKSRIVYATINDKWNHTLAENWLAQGQEQQILDNAVVSRPGLYGWDKIDTGSALLAKYFSHDLNGSVADFGCGWGYLSLQAAKSSEKITRLTLVDVDSRAVDIARRNVQGQHAHLPIETVWADLSLLHAKLGPFDTILLNPPFHAGTQSVPALGQAIITTAAQTLKPSGQLYIVANRHLPYEKTLGALFKQVQVLGEENGFKAFLCKLPVNGH